MKREFEFKYFELLRNKENSIYDYYYLLKNIEQNFIDEIFNNLMSKQSIHDKNL